MTQFKEGDLVVLKDLHEDKLFGRVQGDHEAGHTHVAVRTPRGDIHMLKPSELVRWLDRNNSALVPTLRKIRLENLFAEAANGSGLSPAEVRYAVEIAVALLIKIENGEDPRPPVTLQPSRAWIAKNALAEGDNWNNLSPVAQSRINDLADILLAITGHQLTVSHVTTMLNRAGGLILEAKTNG